MTWWDLPYILLQAFVLMVALLYAVWWLETVRRAASLYVRLHAVDVSAEEEPDAGG